jgi:cell wall-associated NlpC family hydrolase
MITQQEQRTAVVREAHEWVGTRFADRQCCKGIAADCLGFVVGVFRAALGIFADFQIPEYSPQHHLHHNEELYLEGLEKHCIEVTHPQPGDIALFHFAKCYSHAGIIVGWPMVIHCYVSRGVVLSDASRDAALRREARNFPPRFFSPWRPE